MAFRIAPDGILDATSTCIARVGLHKTTLDDVARAAGCSRATLYRFFPGKQQLLAALVIRDARALCDELIAQAAPAPELADAVAIVVSGAARRLSSHPALTFVATHEPDLLLPYLAFERESALLRAAAELVAPAFTRFLEPERAACLAEWAARMTFSYLSCPSDYVDVTDTAQVRSFVDEFVLPSVSVSNSGRSQ